MGAKQGLHLSNIAIDGDMGDLGAIEQSPRVVTCLVQWARAGSAKVHLVKTWSVLMKHEFLVI